MSLTREYFCTKTPDDVWVKSKIKLNKTLNTRKLLPKKQKGKS